MSHSPIFFGELKNFCPFFNWVVFLFSPKSSLYILDTESFIRCINMIFRYLSPILQLSFSFSFIFSFLFYVLGRAVRNARS